jgi:hypothetical protein
MTDFLNRSSLVATTRGYMPIDVHKKGEKCISRRESQIEMHADHAVTSAKNLRVIQSAKISGEEFDVTESLGSA